MVAKGDRGTRGPQYLRSDNGPEFIAEDRAALAGREQIKTIYIDPGSPWQNGFVESFHGRLRDECLNREQLWTLTEARVVVEDFRRRYNLPPAAQQAGLPKPGGLRGIQPTPSPAPVGLRPPCAGDGQTNSDKLNQQTNPSD